METEQGQTVAVPALGRYEIDTDSSAVTFATRHFFGLGAVRGTLAVRSGTVDVVEPLAESRVRVEVATASFSTGNGQRDGQVRSARFLDADNHPVMTFASEGVDGSSVTGTLTVRGVTRPVRLAIERSAVEPDAFTMRATTRIDRTTFGVSAQRGMVGRHLDVTVEVRCVRS